MTDSREDFDQRSWLHWLREKRHEIPHLRLRDVVLAKAVADIRRHTHSCRCQWIPLAACRPIHAIDRPTAIHTLRQRTATIRRHRQQLLAQRRIDERLLQQLLPSVSRWHGVRHGTQVVTFEGNGRLLALQRGLGPAGLRLEVPIMIHELNDGAKIIRRVERARRLNDLKPLES